VEVQFHAFLTSVLDGGVVSFTSEEKAPDMRLTGGWMEEPRSGLDAVEKRNTCPCRESNQNFLVDLSLYGFNYPDTIDIHSFSLSLNEDLKVNSYPCSGMPHVNFKRVRQ
jgi:hypothetical protein